MELVLIILGGTLSTAIIFMIIDHVRGNVPEDEDDLVLQQELQERFPHSKEPN